MEQPCDWDQESYCTVDECSEPATHRKLVSAGPVAGLPDEELVPVYELVCCRHAVEAEQESLEDTMRRYFEMYAANPLPPVGSWPIMPVIPDAWAPWIIPDPASYLTIMPSEPAEYLTVEQVEKARAELGATDEWRRLYEQTPIDPFPTTAAELAQIGRDWERQLGRWRSKHPPMCDDEFYGCFCGLPPGHPPEQAHECPAPHCRGRWLDDTDPAMAQVVRYPVIASMLFDQAQPPEGGPYPLEPRRDPPIVRAPRGGIRYILGPSSVVPPAEPES